MSKYSALRDWLRLGGEPTVTLSFDRLAAIVPGGLPPSAFTHDAWWSNEADGQHVQSTSGWTAAGYRVAHVDRTARVVTFDLVKPVR